MHDINPVSPFTFVDLELFNMSILDVRRKHVYCLNALARAACVTGFIDLMCALGYKRAISIYSFDKPNFELVADCLVWLIKQCGTENPFVEQLANLAFRCDPDAEIADEIYTESDRVALLTKAGKTLYAQLRIKLNLKRLYSADENAVGELLKIANLLYQARYSPDEPASVWQLEILFLYCCSSD